MENGNVKHEGLELDIGCGNAKHRGCIGIDQNSGKQVDIVRSLSSGLPFCSQSVDRIFAHNIFEHLGNEFEFVVSECWRVLKVGGTISVVVPGAFSEGAMRDPTHKRHFTKNTFGYFTPERPKYHEYLPGCPFRNTVSGENDGTIKVIMQKICP